jgi:hypothetical protein
MTSFNVPAHGTLNKIVVREGSCLVFLPTILWQYLYTAVIIRQSVIKPFPC